VHRSIDVTGQNLIIPPRFAQHTVEAFGRRGEVWLRTLPALVAGLARRWRLALGAPFPLSYNYVVAARRADGTEAVLKIGVPNDELAREIWALRQYDGNGTCRLLEADQTRFAMLLERLRPGTMLVKLARQDDEAATRAGAAVMRTLWRPAPSHLEGRLAGPKPIAEWFDRSFARYRAVYGGSGPLPATLFERAERTAQALLASAPATVLLHGDLHHYNILSARRAPWLAIDPKGMSGDPGYEVGPFLLNPDLGSAEQRPDVLRRRLEVFAEELGYHRDRLRDWGIAHGVLSACWSLEDEGYGWEGAIGAAETLAGL
jgi:streptomycin 6-kinase